MVATRAEPADRLSRATLPRVPAGLRPTVDPGAVTAGIVHLGIGAFHRAHQAAYTEAAMAATGDASWGICGVTQRSRAVLDQLAPQDGLYTLLQRSGDRADARVLAAVREVLFAREQAEQVLDALAAPATRVVTLTVTEKGYRHDPADLAGRAPVTVVGQLVRGLQRRRRADAGPLTIVSCDNLPGNGRVLQGLVRELAGRLPAAEGGPLLDWMATQVRFPRTMVDRIVPATTEDDRREVAALLGLRDEGAVVTEPFTQWVIEDDFAGARPAWERAGATLTADVAAYEAMKLRLLNGSHSAMAYLGGLTGHEHIADVVADEAMAGFVRDLMQRDTGPTLAPPPGFDLAGYQRRLLERFANPALRHRTAQVATDGSQKLPQRLLGPIRERLAAGAQPRHACLAVAAWMRYVTAGTADDGRPLLVDDPLAERIGTLTAGATGPGAVVEALLGLREVFGDDLQHDAAFRALVTDALTTLTDHGAAAAVRALEA